MKINVNDATRTVEVWVDSSERVSYKENAGYKAAVEKYKKKYSINVFIGGSKPLLQTITELLKEQTSTMAQAS